MNNIRCFFLEPTLGCVHYIQRFGASHGNICNGRIHGHFASADLFVDDIVLGEDGYWRAVHEIPEIAPDDDRWPQTCNHCNYKFTSEDSYSSGTHRLYRRSDTQEEIILRDAPIGALWYAVHNYLYQGMGIGEDGHALYVRTPGGDHNIDSRASNCTMPDDDVHRCWIRHGLVPNIHVDKNGHSCQAGAGSFVIGTWHGFLHNGELVTC